MDNDNHDNVINAYIPKKDARVDDLYYAICDAIDDNKDGISRAAIIGVLAIIQSDWINKWWITAFTTTSQPRCD